MTFGMQSGSNTPGAPSARQILRAGSFSKGQKSFKKAALLAANCMTAGLEGLGAQALARQGAGE